VGRRRAAQRPAGGGVGIQALRTARARIALGALSVLAYGGVAGYAVGRSSGALAATIPLVCFGAALLAFALLRASVDLVAWPVGLAGTAYAVTVVAHGSGVDGAAPLVAVGLLLCGELAAWSMDERFAIPAEPSVVLARAGALAALAVGSLAVAAALVALASAPAGSGLAWTVLGAASAVAVVALAVRLARRA
jgi:hypothetical protein